MDVKSLMNDLLEVVVAAGTLVLVIVLFIIVLLETKNNPAVIETGEASNYSSTAINDSITAGVTAIQTPIDWISLIVLFLVLAGVIALFILAIRRTQKAAQF